ncbi:MAG: TonB-dependent receptor [Chromatocurvus sp.]
MRKVILVTMTSATIISPSLVAQVKLEEVVVTAQYREERLQDVPVAVTAFTADDILRAGIENTQDFINLTPNITMDDSFTIGNTFVQVRGVAQINNADSPVAIVVDGVPQNNQKQFKQELVDIERIEVLKGPQGALYGRNAIGGAINIVTRQPTNDFEGFVKAGAGNGGLTKVSGALSGPVIKDRLLFRVTGAYKDFDGVIDNTFLNEEVDFYTTRDVRAKLLWRATETIDVDLRYAWSDADGGCCYDTFVVNPAGTGANPARDNFDEPYTNVLGETTEKRFNEATLKIGWDAAFGRVDYILGYSDIQESYFADLDFTDGVETSLSSVLGLGLGQAQELDVDLLSHELRFTSRDDARVRWVGGLYYLETDRDLTTTVFGDIPGTEPVFSPEEFLPLNVIDETNDNTAWAVFGQAEVDLSDALELTLGLRYDEDERDHTGLSPVATAKKQTYDDLQPKVMLTYRFSDNVLSYGGYSRGFRSGGFNGPGTENSREFREETLDNFEIGFKSTFWDQRLRLNGAVFYAESDNFQFFFVDIASGAQVIDNIDEVELLGAEFDFQAAISKELLLFGSFGYTDTEIIRSSRRPQDEGNKTPKNQEFSLNLGGEYRRPVSNGLELALRVDYEHRGKKYWHPDNLNPMDDFGLLNARASLNGEHFGVTLWGKNLGDELFWQDYNASAFSGLPFGDIGFLSRGITWGADVEYRF